jgi:hypothetical protein
MCALMNRYIPQNLKQRFKLLQHQQHKYTGILYILQKVYGHTLSVKYVDMMNLSARLFVKYTPLPSSIRLNTIKFH